VVVAEEDVTLFALVLVVDEFMLPVDFAVPGELDVDLLIDFVVVVVGSV